MSKRLTKHSNDTIHENGICCTHFRGKECERVGGNCALGCKWEEEVWSKLAYYEDLLENNRLIELPCKIGDTVYKVVHDWYHKSFFVAKSKFTLDILEDIGVSVFLTQEEAKKVAMRKMVNYNE